jgi:hypothetical protein
LVFALPLTLAFALGVLTFPFEVALARPLPFSFARRLLLAFTRPLPLVLAWPLALALAPFADGFRPDGRLPLAEAFPLDRFAVAARFVPFALARRVPLLAVFVFVAICSRRAR